MHWGVPRPLPLAPQDIAKYTRNVGEDAARAEEAFQLMTTLPQEANDIVCTSMIKGLRVGEGCGRGCSGLQICAAYPLWSDDPTPMPSCVACSMTSTDTVSYATRDHCCSGTPPPTDGHWRCRCSCLTSDSSSQSRRTSQGSTRTRRTAFWWGRGGVSLPAVAGGAVVLC